MQTTNHVFWLSDLQVWLCSNEKMSRSYIASHPPWKMISSFAIWNIWKSRNNFVFNGWAQNPRLATEIVNQTMEFMYYYSSPRNPIRSIVKRVRWEKPPRGWAKLNTDGASFGNPGLTSCGGIVRDEHGNWVDGFSRKIGITSGFMVELWGLRDRLTLCNT